MIEKDKKYLISKVRTVKDWPKKGVMFRDVTTLIKDTKAFDISIRDFVERYKNKKIDYIVGIESRGFIFGSVVAHLLGLGFIPVRKKGKLPSKTISVEYELEYGTAAIEIHTDALKKGDRVVIIDDLLATGGTMLAATKLIKKVGGKVIECAFVINLPELKGEELIKKEGLDVYTQIGFEGE